MMVIGSVNKNDTLMGKNHPACSSSLQGSAFGLCLRGCGSNLFPRRFFLSFTGLLSRPSASLSFAETVSASLF